MVVYTKMEQLIKQITENSILGALLIISLFVIRFLYNENKSIQLELRTLQDKRLEDMRESRDAILHPLQALQNTVNTILNTVEREHKR